MNNNLLFDAFPIDQPPPIIYHYTTRLGFLGIIEKRAIWASNSRYLNDSREFKIAVEMAKFVLAELINEQSNETEKKALEGFRSWIAPQNEGQYQSYVCSFSENGDSLSQWRGYTKAGDGYALGIDTSELSTLIESNKVQGNIFRLGRCRYDEEEQKMLLKKTFELAIKTARGGSSNDTSFEEYCPIYCLYMFLSIAPLIKDKAFKEEREWRLIASLHTNPQPELAFRSGKSMLIPYISVSLGEWKLPICNVIIGPSPHGPLDSQAVLQLLRLKDALTTSCSRSVIPFRDW